MGEVMMIQVSLIDQGQTATSAAIMVLLMTTCFFIVKHFCAK